MRAHLIAASLAAALVTAWPPHSMSASQTERDAAPRESPIPVGKASLHAREIGQGQPVIVLHGGPDFDSGYLLPDLDRLADCDSSTTTNAGVESLRKMCSLKTSRSHPTSTISTG